MMVGILQAPLGLLNKGTHLGCWVCINQVSPGKKNRSSTQNRDSKLSRLVALEVGCSGNNAYFKFALLNEVPSPTRFHSDTPHHQPHPYSYPAQKPALVSSNLFYLHFETGKPMKNLWLFRCPPNISDSSYMFSLWVGLAKAFVSQISFKASCKTLPALVARCCILALTLIR